MNHNSGLRSGILGFVQAEVRSVAEEVRAFNRFYSEAIGSLDDRHEGLNLSLAQSRVLFTVSTMQPAYVNEIAERLHLDLAYSSRLLGFLEDEALVQRSISSEDRRQRVVTLTPKGRRTLTDIEQRSNQRVEAMVGHLRKRELTVLLAAMKTIERLLTKEQRQ